jgi:hypothetical protein
MPIQTVWISGNSLVITITQHFARVYGLMAGSIVHVEKMKHTNEGFRVIPPPLRYVSRAHVISRPKRRAKRA